jgi:cytidine deaminase
MQRTLLEVAAAADDLVAIFRVGQREPASLFTVWAARQVTSHTSACTQLGFNVAHAAFAQLLCAKPSPLCTSSTHSPALTSSAVLVRCVPCRVCEQLLGRRDASEAAWCIFWVMPGTQ